MARGSRRPAKPVGRGRGATEISILANVRIHKVNSIVGGGKRRMGKERGR